MSIEKKQIHDIAKLARLAISDAELDLYSGKLVQIIALATEMNTVDTETVKPMFHPLDIIQRLQPDAITEPDQSSMFQALAPEVADGLYLVPQVLDENS